MTAWAPVITEQSADWHRHKFVEFCKFKQQVGEPSPHMTLAGWLLRRWGRQRRG